MPRWISCHGVDGFALSRDSLPTCIKQGPRSRMVGGAFQQIGIPIAPAKNEPGAQAAVSGQGPGRN